MPIGKELKIISALNDSSTKTNFFFVFKNLFFVHVKITFFSRNRAVDVAAKFIFLVTLYFVFLFLDKQHLSSLFMTFFTFSV